MSDQAAQEVEWDEPPGSPENHDFVMPCKDFMRLCWKTCSKMLQLVASLMALVLLVELVTRNPTPFKNAGVVAAVIIGLAAGVMAVFFPLLYMITLRVQRKVRVTATGIEYSILLQRKHFGYAEVSRVWIEPVENGDHRLVVAASHGELCRLRLPAAMDVDAVLRIIPKEKIRQGAPGLV